MRFSEIFLRLGCSLVGWMVVIAYFLWLAVAGKIGCGEEANELHRLLLFAAPAAAAFALLTQSTRPMPDVHGVLRWIAILPVLLLPFALVSVWGIARVLYFDGETVCAGASFAGLMSFWPVVQIIAIALCMRSFAQMWLKPGA